MWHFVTPFSDHGGIRSKTGCDDLGGLCQTYQFYDSQGQKSSSNLNKTRQKSPQNKAAAAAVKPRTIFLLHHFFPNVCEAS